MTLTGKFVFVAAQEGKLDDGKSYFKATLLCNDNSTCEVGLSKETADSMTQFQPYVGDFDYKVYSGKGKLRLLRAVPADAPTVTRKGA